MKPLAIIVVFATILVLLVTPASGEGILYRVAVLPFDDGSLKDRWWDSNLQLGNETADEMITVLMGTKRFRLIERGEIDKVLHEQNLGSQGIIDPKTAAKIGKILGVQYLVIGRITEFTRKNNTNALGSFNMNNPMGMIINTTTSRTVIDARLVDTTTAEILTSITGTGEKKNIILGTATKDGVMVFGSEDFKKSDMGKALRQAVNSAAYQLASRAYDGNTIPTTMITGKVAYVSPEGIIINIGAKDGVRTGMIFSVLHPVDQVKDPESGVVVDEVTEPVAEIIITIVKERSATCTVLTKLGSKFEIAVADRVRTKEPVKMAALPKLKPPLIAVEVDNKRPNTIYADLSIFDCDNFFNNTLKDYGYMSMYGGELHFSRYKIGGERVMASEIRTNPAGKVEISEFKIGYDLNNDSDYKMMLYAGTLFVDWNDGVIKNSSYMFGADVGYELAEKTYIDISFGYGLNPITQVNGVDEGSWTTITTAKLRVSYAISASVDLYAGYRTYTISRPDHSLSGINAGLELKF